jgi:hypothetical protein
MKNKRVGLLLFPFILGTLACAGVAQTPPPDALPRLSQTQLQVIKSIRAEGEKGAAPLALHLAAVAKRIYENMLSEREDAALRRKLSREMEKVAAQLLAIKGQSIRGMVRVLTPEQRSIVRNEMRKPDAPGDLSELIARVFGIPEK